MISRQTKTAAATLPNAFSQSPANSLSYMALTASWPGCAAKRVGILFCGHWPAVGPSAGHHTSQGLRSSAQGMDAATHWEFCTQGRGAGWTACVLHRHTLLGGSRGSVPAPVLPPSPEPGWWGGSPSVAHRGSMSTQLSSVLAALGDNGITATYTSAFFLLLRDTTCIQV